MGAYLDSGDNWAKFAALGYQLRLGRRWKVGAALAAIHSRTYNNGTAFVGMIPLVTWDLGRFKLNAVYFRSSGTTTGSMSWVSISAFRSAAWRDDPHYENAAGWPLRRPS